MTKMKERKIINCACGCGETLFEDDGHYRKRKYINGHNNRKYDDPTQYKREWNYRNKESRTKYRRDARRKRKGILIKYKGSECEECGLFYDGTNACVFDFHHTQEKNFGISGHSMERSIEKLKKECDKCELLCANCHRIKHALEEY